MGFVSNSSDIELNAFYTQKGRAYYLNGSDLEKRIKFFSLDDSDTNYIVSTNNNTLENGFVPDVSGNYDSCDRGVADGAELSNFIYFKKETDSINKEIRFFNDSNGDFFGKNILNIKVDLYKYSLWCRQNGTFSNDTTAPYNTQSPNLSSPFIKFFDSIKVFDKNTNVISDETKTFFSFSEKDYKNYEQLNRVLLKSGFTDNYYTVVPNNNQQSSPLVFMFSTQGNNNGNYGQGIGGLILNNRDYGYCVINKSTNEKIFVSKENIDTQLTFSDNIIYDIVPCVQLNYYRNGILTSELFTARTTLTNLFYTNANVQNQYLKLFLNENNKTLIVRETELLEEFIESRTDLFFQNKLNSYVSYPITIFVNSEDNVRYGALKITLVYDKTKTYNLTPNETFVI